MGLPGATGKASGMTLQLLLRRGTPMYPSMMTSRPKLSRPPNDTAGRPRFTAVEHLKDPRAKVRAAAVAYLKTDQTPEAAFYYHLAQYRQLYSSSYPSKR